MRLNNMMHEFIFSDRRRAGLSRLFFFVGIPILLLATNIYTRLAVGYLFTGGWILIIYLFGFISATATATYYLKDIYDEDFDRMPFRYFLASYLAWFQPHIHIDATGKNSRWLEMVEKIGGPAFLEIDPGWVVLTESLTAPEKVYGRGKKHFMSRNERIHEIVDLREQEGSPLQVTATTCDGIKVWVEDIRFNYRIWDSRWEGLYRDQSITRNPYPYSKKAILDYAYNRHVQLDSMHKPQLLTWQAAVGVRVAGIIKEYINERRLDDVIAPREQDNRYVRNEIRKKAYQPEFRDGMRSLGTLLRWWDPGEFRSQEEIKNQFFANWSVDIQSNIHINKARGEAQKMAYEELGRAEAEAELLMSIINALDGIQLGKDKIQTLQNLILLHTAQVIKAFGNSPTDGSSQKKLPS